MQDGIGQVGASVDDRRLAGRDLQHNVQLRTADEAVHHHRMHTAQMGQGGPVKEALDREMSQHKGGRDMRLKHLEQHYQR